MTLESQHSLIERGCRGSLERLEQRCRVFLFAKFREGRAARDVDLWGTVCRIKEGTASARDRKFYGQIVEQSRVQFCMDLQQARKGAEIACYQREIAKIGPAISLPIVQLSDNEKIQVLQLETKVRSLLQNVQNNLYFRSWDFFKKMLKA